MIVALTAVIGQRYLCPLRWKRRMLRTLKTMAIGLTTRPSHGPQPLATPTAGSSHGQDDVGQQAADRRHGHGLGERLLGLRRRVVGGGRPPSPAPSSRSPLRA